MYIFSGLNVQKHPIRIKPTTTQKNPLTHCIIAHANSNDSLRLRPKIVYKEDYQKTGEIVDSVYFFFGKIVTFSFCFNGDFSNNIRLDVYARGFEKA